MKISARPHSFFVTRRVSHTLLASVFVLVSSSALTQPEAPLGYWQMLDDQTVIELYACNQSKLCGRIAQPPAKQKDDPADWDPNTLCATQILGELEPKEERWVNGWVLDPESQERFKATLSPQPDGRLKLRAYTMFESLNESFLLARHTQPIALCTKPEAK